MSMRCFTGCVQFARSNLLTTVIRSMSVDTDFSSAQSKLQTLKNDPGNAEKLKVYALFKQGTEGKCNKPKPGMMDFVGKAKWDAWNSLGSMSPDEAKQAYVTLVSGLVKAEGGSQTSESTVPSSSESKYKEILVSKEGRLLKMTLNRPSKKNAINTAMYNEWIDILTEAGSDSSVDAVCISGAGDFFCSGNDLSNFTNLPPGMSIEQMALNGRDLLKKFVAAFIDFPKPLIGAINGPAVGVSVTTLALYDLVVASDNATFSVPFSQLGQTPEGCSSFTFPRMMGLGPASSLLMFNRKINAQEACSLGLVSMVVPRGEFTEQVSKLLAEYKELPAGTMAYSKQLIRAPIREKLHQVNAAECERLCERWVSDDCINAITKFFTRKSKM